MEEFEFFIIFITHTESPGKDTKDSEGNKMNLEDFIFYNSQDKSVLMIKVN